VSFAKVYLAVTPEATTEITYELVVDVSLKLVLSYASTKSIDMVLTVKMTFAVSNL